MADTTQDAVAQRPKTKAGTRTAATAKAAPTKEIAASAPEPAAKARFGFFRGLVGQKAGTDDPAPEVKTSTGKSQEVKASAGKTQATETTAKPKMSFTSLLTGRSTGPGGRPAQPGMGRFFFGMSLYMLLALGAQFGLGYLFQQVPGHGAQVLVTLPLIGPVTVALFTWMVVLIGILFALYKFNVLPRTLGGQPRQKVTSVTADAKGSKTAAAKPVREPLSGPNDESYARVKARIRAERRKARH